MTAQEEQEQEEFTLLGYKWQIRNGALAAVMVNGVDSRSSMAALDRAGAGPDVFPEWCPDQPISNKFDLARLPRGSIVSQTEKGKPDTLTLFKVVGENLQRIGGPMAEPQAIHTRPVRPVLVGSEPPTGTWLKGEPAEAIEVDEFRAAVWREGHRAKAENSWCGTYEHVMRRLGITAASATPINAWFRRLASLDQRRVRDLSEGTYVAWQSDLEPFGRYRVWVRDNATRSPSRTRLVFQSSRYESRVQTTTRGMRVLPLDGLAFEVAAEETDFTEWPVGTQFQSSGGDRYQIALDHRASQGWGHLSDEGRYRASEFGTNNLIITRIGE